MTLSACRWVQARLPLLAGDDLIGPDRRRTERHLVSCPDCRRHLASLRKVVRLLHEAAELPTFAPGTPSLWPELARQIRESRGVSMTLWPRLLTSPFVALAATLFLTLGTAAVWSRLLPSGPDSREVIAVTDPESERVLVSDVGDFRDERSEETLVAVPSGRSLDGDQAATETRNTH